MCADCNWHENGLVYVGRIIDLHPIEAADFLVSATVVCGGGGKWRGVVRKTDFQLSDLCVVFLPDALVPERPDMDFLKSSNWRVKMRRFRGAPSEVVIMPHKIVLSDCVVGRDVTDRLGVVKYHKPVPAHLQGIAKGDFPSFIPKTDEPNYQSNPELVENLVSKPWYMTEKADGSSTTAFHWKGDFGVCSRNFELERDEKNGYWKVAIMHQLEKNLPEGIAIQWETCGPGIQSNPMGLKEISGFLFSAYKIEERRYLTFHELKTQSRALGFPMAKILDCGGCFSNDGIEFKGEGLYENGHQREGVVIRSQENQGSSPISFKVINLNFEK